MTLLNQNQIASINKRYTDRLRIHGSDPRTLGWSSKEQQKDRFNRFIRYFDCTGKTFLDIGCGLGDFASYIYDHGQRPSHYIGVDINPDLLDEASKHERHGLHTSFMLGNILDSEFFDQVLDTRPEVIAAAGIFNLNFCQNSDQMIAFMKSMLKAMISLSPERIIIDFIPTCRSDSYDAEEYIATYSIGEVADFLAGQEVRFIVDLSQAPNPMTEALLVLDE